MKEDITREIELNEGVSAVLSGTLIKIKGPKGEVDRDFPHPKIGIEVKGNKIILKSTKATKREKTVIGSFAAHIGNMQKGVQEHHLYRLKICSGHFPMNVSVSGEEIIIKNFLGEAVPRRVSFASGVKVEVKGDEIVVSGPDREAAGQTAARIEKLCRVSNRDIRIFQDGCYIIHKCGRNL